MKFERPIVADLLGGLTAAIVALPITLAFGVASGIGPAAGLYGAIACGIFAAAFGGTPGQVSGPTGPMTVVAAAMLAANPTRPDLVLASVCFAGLFQILFGRIRAGQLINYVPYPVVSGFMTGIGVIIIILQLRPFVGLPTMGAVLNALQAFPDLFTKASPGALYTGFLTLLIIYLVPRLTKRLPAALIALFVGTAASIFFAWNAPTIGSIPQGVPLPVLPKFALHELNTVLMNAISLAVLGSIDSLLTSVVVDKVRKSRHDSDQELVGQGLGNLIAGLFGGLPGAGATMRSVVNIKAGGTTRWSGVVHGLLLLAVLLGLGPYAEKIPQACLAAILISVGISIIDYRGLRSIRKAPRSDIVVMLVVLFLTVFVDLIIAVGVGITLASTLFAKKLADVRLTQLGNLESVEHLVEVSEQLPKELRERIFIYSFNGPLFFGEMRNFTETIDHLSDARYIILRFSNVPIIDQTAVYALEDAVERWRTQGTKVIFTGMQQAISKTLYDFGVLRGDDPHSIFDHSEAAIEFIAEHHSQAPNTIS